jgi:hypothetical protein
MFDMKLESEKKIKHGCCYPESKTEPVGCTRAIDMLEQSSSTSSISHSPVFVLGNEERRAVEAHKLQVEMWRSMAIELARRNTLR